MLLCVRLRRVQSTRGGRLLTFKVDYFILIAAAFFGALQVVASMNGLKGLRLLPGRLVGVVLGLVIVSGSFAGFFAGANRAVEGHITQVQGAEQFYLFLLGVCAAIAFTAALVSLLRLGGPRGRTAVFGLDALREQTYLQAWIGLFRRGGPSKPAGSPRRSRAKR